MVSELFLIVLLCIFLLKPHELTLFINFILKAIRLFFKYISFIRLTLLNFIRL